MNNYGATAVAVSFLLAVPPLVASADAMKELGVYKDGVGTWACDAREVESGNGFKAVVEKTVDFDGNTYIERYYEIANPDHPNAWKGIFIMSYDPQSQRWVRNGIDNSGERNVASSSGWHGNTWVWENEGVNIVITQRGSEAYAFAVDVKQSDGIKRVVEAVCRRA